MGFRVTLNAGGIARNERRRLSQTIPNKYIPSAVGIAGNEIGSHRAEGDDPAVLINNWTNTLPVALRTSRSYRNLLCDAGEQVANNAVSYSVCIGSVEVGRVGAEHYEASVLANARAAAVSVTLNTGGGD